MTIMFLVDIKKLLIHSISPYRKGKKVWVLVIALLTRLEQQRFTISEMAADWHELMIPWRIMRPSIAHDGELIARTISPTPSLFAAKRRFTYSQGNMGKFWGD